MLFVGGLIGALALAGGAVLAGAGAGAAQAGTAGRLSPPDSGVRTCAAYAYQAIERQELVTGMPAACAGLSRAQVNQAASTAIRQASGNGPKSAWRKKAGRAEPWVSALLTGQVPAPATAATSATSAGQAGSSLLGGVSELAMQVSALLAWLATAMSGGYILLRWLLAGGSLRRRSPTAAPPAVTAGHAGFGLLGLVLWGVFMATGWTALAWAAVGIMAPVAGLGMGVLTLGLPSPRPETPRPETPAPASARLGSDTATATIAPPVPAVKSPSRPRAPVLAIVAHGMFAATALLLVLLATIGAG